MFEICLTFASRVLRASATCFLNVLKAVMDSAEVLWPLVVPFTALNLARPSDAAVSAGVTPASVTADTEYVFPEGRMADVIEFGLD